MIGTAALSRKGAVIMLLVWVFSAGQTFADQLSATIADIEAEMNARVGVAPINVETGEEWTHRGHERFAMASTFKALLCGVILLKVDRMELTLTRKSQFEKKISFSFRPSLKVVSNMTLRLKLYVRQL